MPCIFTGRMPDTVLHSAAGLGSHCAMACLEPPPPRCATPYGNVERRRRDPLLLAAFPFCLSVCLHQRPPASVSIPSPAFLPLPHPPPTTHHLPRCLPASLHDSRPPRLSGVGTPLPSSPSRPLLPPSLCQSLQSWDKAKATGGALAAPQHSPALHNCCPCCPRPVRGLHKRLWAVGKAVRGQVPTGTNRFEGCRGPTHAVGSADHHCMKAGWLLCSTSRARLESPHFPPFFVNDSP